MYSKIKQISFKLTCAMLPLLAGCGGGGGGTSASSGVGSLFAGLSGGGVSGGTGTGGGSEVLPLLADGGSAVADATIATIHNPEPASLLLVGGGMAALALYRSRKNVK